SLRVFTRRVEDLRCYILFPLYNAVHCVGRHAPEAVVKRAWIGRAEHLIEQTKLLAPQVMPHAERGAVMRAASIAIFDRLAPDNDILGQHRLTDAPGRQTNWTALASHCERQRLGDLAEDAVSQAQLARLVGSKLI